LIVGAVRRYGRCAVGEELLDGFPRPSGMQNVGEGRKKVKKKVVGERGNKIERRWEIFLIRKFFAGSRLTISGVVQD
jgi:hypothetical protein